MNNRTFLFILALLGTLVGCDWTHKAPPPTQEEIIHLIAAIPDHQFFEKTKDCYTDEYYRALKKAWAVPSDGLGEIGSDEWLYYFITGNDDCNDFRIDNISTVSHGRHATVQFVSTSCQTPSTHTMELIYHKKAWVIADYDTTLAALKNYVVEQTKYFRQPQWQQKLDEALADPNWAEMARERQHEVEHFLSLQPR